MPPFTILDIAKRVGGAQPELIDLMVNEDSGTFYKRLPMKPISGLVEKFNQKTGLPTVGFRDLGEGVAASKGKSKPVQEGVYLLSGFSETDRQKALTDPRGVKQVLIEDAGDHLNSMGKKLSFQTFYGVSSEGGFDGLFTRLPDTADTFESCGGSVEKLSLYAVKFGPKQFMGIYQPYEKGEIIEMVQHGVVVVSDADGKKNSFYQTEFNGKIGIAQYNPKAIGRLGKIDSSHAPTLTQLMNLFNKMGMKPDLLVCNYATLGILSEQKKSALVMTPGDKDVTSIIGYLEGIPILVDNDIKTDEGA